jgi:hypothetical protein
VKDIVDVIIDFIDKQLLHIAGYSNRHKRKDIYQRLLNIINNRITEIDKIDDEFSAQS